MIASRREFYGGIGLFGGFIVVLIIMFMPIFGGKNALDYLDSLYNSISKGSAYYIPKVREDTDKLAGIAIQVTLPLTSETQAKQTAALFEKSGASVEIADDKLQITGDLGKILENSLADADLMYRNEGPKLSEKYGYPEKRVMFNWWNALQGMDKVLKKQKLFEAAQVVDLVTKKAVETAYNYYGIQPQNISDRFGIVLFSLFFYVAYTLWYGFAILLMFEGWGLKLGH
jgi:hypothetical protein